MQISIWPAVNLQLFWYTEKAKN